MHTKFRRKIQFRNSEMYQDTAYKYRAHLHTAKFYLHGANPSLENGLDYIKQHNMIDQWFNCSMNSSALQPLEHGVIRYLGHTSPRLPALNFCRGIPQGVKSLHLRHHEICLDQTIHRSACHYGTNRTKNRDTCLSKIPSSSTPRRDPKLSLRKTAETHNEHSIQRRAETRHESRECSTTKSTSDRHPTTEPLTDCRARGGEAAAGARCVEWLRRQRSAAGADLYRRNPSKRGGPRNVIGRW